VGEALPFAEIKLGLLESFLCALAISDVLAGAKHLVGPSRCISLQIAGTVNDSHLAAGANEPVFRFDVHTVTNRPFCVLEYVLSIFRMDQLSYYFQINGIFLRFQAIDAAGFV
jgi:hypothetical protein